jgi:hypothetical protein
MTGSHVKQTVSLRFDFTVAAIRQAPQANRLRTIFGDRKRAVVLEIDESLIYSRFTSPLTLLAIGFRFTKVFSYDEICKPFVRYFA